MTLEVNSTFGNYRIGDVIGEGGMGQVYRATDTTLDREVAIKVLPESFASDKDRVSRFEQEAKTLASLNHPNIGMIFGLEKQGDTIAIVMELVEGPTLADRIAKGPLPPEEALRIARQIIDGLEAAHARGVVHRDLKPANIKIKEDGLVKILDFGIAKPGGVEGSSGGGKTPTLITPAVTETGIIMGTAAYMSPEQARGRNVDQRTDIWAFGCLLYEMLTGQPAFGGEDVAETLARIITLEADTGSLTGVINPGVQHTIDLCLQKDLKKRLADIRDVRLSLQGEFASYGVAAASESTNSGIKSFWPKAIALSVVVAALVGVIGWQLKPEPPRPVARFVHPIPEGRTLFIFGPTILDIAPDGQRLVYNSSDGLIVREMDAIEDRVIPGTGDVRVYPTFSPDGESLAFLRPGNGNNGVVLVRVAITGGAVVELAALGEQNARGINWETDGTLLIGRSGEGIWRVSENGGEPELIVEIEANQDLLWPQLLPGGEWVLFTLAQGGADTTRWDGAEIVAQSLVTGERRSLRGGASSGRYVPTGHLVYGFGNTLFAVAFDPENLEVSGGPVPVVQGVRRESALGLMEYAFADDGTLIYVPGSNFSSGLNDLVIGNGQGQAQSLSVPAGTYRNPRVSPDGRWIAYEAQYGDGFDIAVYEIATNNAAPRRLTFGGDNTRPAWSADGTHVAYASARDMAPGIWWRLVDGSGPEEQITQAAEGETHVPDSFSPDGKSLAYTITAENVSAIWLLDLAMQEGSLLIQSRAPGATHAVFSPDGRWLAYQAWDTGDNEIFVQPFPLTGAKYQLPNNFDNHHPAWSADSKQLYYIPGPGRFERVEVSTERGLGFGNPVALSLGGLLNNAPESARAYDIMPVGSGILGTIQSGASAGESVNGIIVVQNWFEELKRLVPTE